MLPQRLHLIRSITIVPCAAFILLAALLMPHLANAQGVPPRSAWQCLPQETSVAIRIPDGKAFASALREHTKLGSVLLSGDRLERLGQLLVEQDKGAWDKFQTKLRQYGLRADDLPQLFAGDSGFALAIGQGGDGASLVAGLGWLEPGQELATRLVDAIGKAVDALAENDQAVKRIDFEIDGQPVVQLDVPVAHYELDAKQVELPENFDELNDEQQRQAIQEAQKDIKAEKTVRYHCVLLTRLAGRLLWAATLKPSKEGVSEQVVEQLTGLMARFLAAHQQAEPGGFVSHVATAEGVRDVLAQPGTTALEILADVSPLIRLAQSDAETTLAKVIKALGAQQLGATVVRVTLDGGLLRSGFFAAMPAPRTGVLALLDQPPVPAEPPSWVPADIIDFSHFSADLGKMYGQIKELVLREVGPQADTTFQMAEAQVQGFAQADLTAVLSSLGHVHSVVTYEPEIAQAANDGQSGVTLDPGQRVALVWQVKDEAIWSRVLQAAGAFAPLANGALQPTDEQGFRGWRLNKEPFEGGLVVGNGFLVLGIGKGVLERTLASLNNPPDGSDALRSSELFTRARTLIDLQPGLSFQLTDGNRYMKTLRRLAETLLGRSGAMAGPADESSDEDDERPVLDEHRAALVDGLRKLLPTEEELEGVLGVSAGFTLVNDEGLLSHAVSELPAQGD